MVEGKFLIVGSSIMRFAFNFHEWALMSYGFINFRIKENILTFKCKKQINKQTKLKNIFFNNYKYFLIDSKYAKFCFL